MDTVSIIVFVLGISLTTAQITGRCGEEQIVGRIIGGTNVPGCTWPYTPLVNIKIYYNDALDVDTNFGNITICGGAIVDSQHILTSASCGAPMVGPSAAVLRQATRIVVGDWDASVPNFGFDGLPEDIIGIEDVKVHGSYNNITTGNNIAIIKLARSISYNNCKRPGCLLSQNARRPCDIPDVDNTCIMASVGLRELDSISTPDIPQQVPVQLLSRTLTEAIVRSTSNVLPEGAVIAKPLDPSVQVCLFDWGGIVVCRNSNRWWLRGIIGTNNCVLSNNPTNRPPPVFVTEVSKYSLWIDACLKNFASVDCQ